MAAIQKRCNCIFTEDVVTKVDMRCKFRFFKVERKLIAFTIFQIIAGHLSRIIVRQQFKVTKLMSA